MIDNLEVAILSKVNALAERHGLKPYDFVATFHHDADTDKSQLAFEVPASGNQLREDRFARMLKVLGVTEGELSGTTAHIIEALDHALENAPRRPGL